MDIVDIKFKEWTEGLNSTESRINIFEKVRDIPYFIDPTLWDFDEGPSKMLRLGKGSCTPKHYLLGRMFQKMGLEVEYCTYPFKWNEMDVKYPDEIKTMAEGLPATYHLACKISVEGSWVLVDATWDTALLEIGFPVNVMWDGRSDTRLAVKARDEFSYSDPRERDIIFKADMSVYGLSEKLQLSRFSIALNKWIDSVRA